MTLHRHAGRRSLPVERLAGRLARGRLGRGGLMDCVSCGEEMPRGECQKSERPCGHHCNHSWSHDACDWCGKTFDNEDDDGATSVTPTPGERPSGGER